jgi:PAS domain-containing protein
MALEQIRGWDWQSVIHPADAPVVLDRWRHALASGDVFEVEYRIRGADGVYRWFLGRALPVRDAGGRIAKWFGTCTDIDTQKRAEGRIVELNGQLQRRVAELQTLLDVLPVGIAIAEDRDCNRLRFNRHFIETWGLAGGTNYSPNVPGDERPGRYELRRGGVPVPDEDLPMKVAAAEGVGVSGDELELVLDDGRIFQLRVDAAPLFDEGGRPRGCVAAIQDVTERERVRRELEEARDAAESAGRAKDRFLAMLGHELRTPLRPCS